MNYSYLKYFENKESDSIINFKNLKLFISSITFKKLISLIIVLICFLGNYLIAFAQNKNGNGITSSQFDTLRDLLLSSQENTMTSVLVAHQFASLFSFIEIPRKILRYVTMSQLDSIDFVSRYQFGSIGMFNHIYLGLTIFAIMGAVYKLITHFLTTERFDNVKAYTGFFGYVGIFVLFLFSQPIVERIVSLNKNISNNSLIKISNTLEGELSSVLKRDYNIALQKVKDIEKRYEEGTDEYKSNEVKLTGVTIFNTSEIKKNWELTKVEFMDMYLSLIFKYSYFSLFICLMICILAIPSFVLAFMVKVLLSVMVAGVKIVFLISMIPGFESTWKTYLLNMVNVILWIPIFNQIIKFIQAIVAGLIHEQSMGSGELIWVSIVVFIVSYQAITLTTTSAGTIISGAGASMAGALSGMSAMNGASVLASAGSLAASGGSAAMSAKMTGSFTSSAIKKFMK